MVFLTRSICRLARPAFTSAARPTPSSSRILSAGALSLRRNNLGSIRTLTDKREKVKVLLVLYDGKKHAEEVSHPQFLQSMELD
jgi:formate dehydrogenase